MAIFSSLKHKPDTVINPWLMLGVYILHAIFGFAIVLTDSLGPSDNGAISSALDEYGAAIAIVSTMSCASLFLTSRFLYIEMLLSGFIFALMSTYIFSVIEPLFMGDLDALRRIAIVLLAALLPLVRSLSLGKVVIRRRLHDS